MLANLFSAARIAVIPFLLYSMYQDSHTESGGSSLTTLGLLFFGLFTDAADGFAARRLGQISRLGKILDPLADKIFLGSLCLALIFWRAFPAWLVALLVLRDLAILAVGLFLLRRRGLVVPANLYGKLNTVCFGLAVIAYMLGAPDALKTALIWGAVLTLAASSASYIRLLAGLRQEKPVH